LVHRFARSIAFHSLPLMWCGPRKSWVLPWGFRVCEYVMC
jgi:hypothetical protein